MNRFIRTLLWAATLCAVGLIASVAAAQSGVEKAMAERLFQDGRRLLKAGKISEACPKFAESYRLVPKLGTLLNLATCHEKEGKAATAWAEFTDALGMARKRGETKREQYAREHIEALEKQLAYITIVLSEAPAGVEVRLDDAILGKATWGTKLPVDPGDHVVVVTAPGMQGWTSDVTVAAGASQRVVVSLEADADTAGADPEVPDEPDDGVDGMLVSGLVFIGVGVVGIGVGAGFGIRTIMLQDESEDHCVDINCDPEGVQLREDGQTSATISNIAFGVGLAAAAAGVILTILSSTDDDEPEAGWRVTGAGVAARW